MTPDTIPPQAGIEMARLFGKCPVKRCKHRHVKDVPAFRKTERDNRTRILTSYLSPVVRHPALPDDNWWGWMSVMQEGWGIKWNPDIPDDRPRCPEHRRLLLWNVLNANYNPEKVCDGRCRSATGPNCECSCNGEQHGADRISF